KVAGRRVKGEIGQELAVRGRIVVYAHRVAPGRPAVIRVAQKDVGVALLVPDFLGVDEVDAPVVCAARAVPRQSGLGVHGTPRLRGDEVEAADVRVGDEDSAAEVGGAEPVRVDVHEQLAAALSAFGEGADLHDLARGPDRD